MFNYSKELVFCEVNEEDIIYLKGNSYTNKNVLVSIPTRGMIHVKVIIGWKTLLYPINSHIAHMFIEGDEIGIARNKTCDALDTLQDINYILFLDDDVILPSHAIVKLFKTMEEGNYDIISGLYHMKDDLRSPIAFRWDKGLLQTISTDEEQSGNTLEVDVVPMGCTLINKRIFNKLSAPFFNTVNENLGYNDTNNTLIMTEDVYFCNKAKKVGAKIGVHTGIRCGHIDTKTGVIY